MITAPAEPIFEPSSYFGYGWFIEPMAGHQATDTGGWVPGFNTEIDRFRAEKLTVIILANEDSGDVHSLIESLEKMIFANRSPRESQPRLPARLSPGCAGRRVSRTGRFTLTLMKPDEGLPGLADHGAASERELWPRFLRSCAVPLQAPEKGVRQEFRRTGTKPHVSVRTPRAERPPGRRCGQNTGT